MEYYIDSDSLNIYCRQYSTIYYLHNPTSPGKNMIKHKISVIPVHLNFGEPQFLVCF